MVANKYHISTWCLLAGTWKCLNWISTGSLSHIQWNKYKIYFFICNFILNVQTSFLRGRLLNSSAHYSLTISYQSHELFLFAKLEYLLENVFSGLLSHIYWQICFAFQCLCTKHLKPYHCQFDFLLLSHPQTIWKLWPIYYFLCYLQIFFRPGIQLFTID